MQTTSVKTRHYTVRPSLELDEVIQYVAERWLADRPKHSMNDWWCEAARLMCDACLEAKPVPKSNPYHRPETIAAFKRWLLASIDAQILRDASR